MFEDAYQSFVRDLIRKEPEWVELCLDFYERAKEYTLDVGKPWEINFRDLFLQEWGSTDSLTAGYLLAQIHYKILHAEVRTIVIGVNAAPFKDAATAENNAVLSKIMPPFKAQFWGKHGAGHGREDGYLEWQCQHELAPVDPDRVFDPNGVAKLPLEVGTCSISTVYHYLHQTQGVARWVYGSKFIYVFYGNASRYMEWLEQQDWLK